MKSRLIISALWIIAVWIASGPDARSQSTPLRLPYGQAGLNERQAAACLLDRFGFGARPGDIERVVKMGPAAWLEQQLDGVIPDTALERRLSGYPTWKMSGREIANMYPTPGMILIMAARDGVISKSDTGQVNRKELVQKGIDYLRQKGFKPQREMLGEMVAEKLLRALYSENQLREVLTDFWFNHFNVSVTDNQAKTFVLAYERDAIRANALGKFRTMLFATARHPAMLNYLDNAQSTAPDSVPTTMTMRLEKYRNLPGRYGNMARRKIDEKMDSARAVENRVRNKIGVKRGINENYARELMELHTLGVDGGYTQKDVVEVARALTGWTAFPASPDRADKLMERARKGEKVGFVVMEDFVFNANGHDATEKKILGETFPAGGGMEEGERVLDMLSKHPSTAKHIARKFAIRFVSDTPSDTLVNRLAAVFTSSDGDTKAMIRAIAESPEFWRQAAVRSKIKSPFEVAISGLRILGTDVFTTLDTYNWIKRMGEPLFACQPPTGFPDRADAWVNTGSLLNRMNFGLSLATKNIMGVDMDLAKLNNNHEPESQQAALITYAQLLMPERDLKETIRLLTPVIQSPEFADKVRAAAAGQPPPQPPAPKQNMGTMEEKDDLDIFDDDDDAMTGASATTATKSGGVSPQSLSQVVGIILGSPEFQRR